MQAKRTNPVTDLVGVLRAMTRREVRFALISVAITLGILAAFFLQTLPKREPVIIYAESWDASRTRDDAFADMRRRVAVGRVMRKEAEIARIANARGFATSQDERETADANTRRATAELARLRTEYERVTAELDAVKASSR